jgi:internalin A
LKTPPFLDPNTNAMTGAVHCTAAHREADALVEDALRTGARELDLSGLRIDALPPRIGLLSGQLESLDLSGCTRLRNLDGLAGLTALQRLNLSQCPELRDLGALAQLTALQQLDLGWCVELPDLDALGGLTALQQLNLSGCLELRDLGALAGLTALQDLNLSQCRELRDLGALARLTALQQLDLSWCGELPDLDALGGLTSLQQLNLSWCRKLQDIGALAGLTALKQLDLRQCPELRDLGALAGLTALQQLNLSSCRELRDLGALAGLTALQQLNLSESTVLRDLGALAGLTALQQLNLSWCRELRDLRALAGLTALQQLDLSQCPELRDLGALAGLTALQQLDLSSCRELRDLGALAGLTALQQLNLSSCRELRDLGALAGLTALQQLDLSWCRKLQDFGALAELTALKQLDLSSCPELRDLGALAGLTALQDLDLSDCPELRDLGALAGLTALQDLDLSHCPELRDLGALAGLTALQRLNLSQCPELRDLGALAGLTALQQLDLSGCPELRELSALAGLTALQQLNLSECPELRELGALAGLTALQQLDLRQCPELRELGALAGLTALRRLDLSGCPELRDLGTLAGLTALRQLDLSGCPKLRDLGALAGLTALQTLKATHIPHPLDLGPLRALTHLRRIDCEHGAGPDLREPELLFEGFPRLALLGATDFLGAPRELGSEHNCLPSLERWFADLQRSGAEPVNELKVFVLGNGHAGKTQIVRRLCGMAFDDQVPSTHGVAIHRFSLSGTPDSGHGVQAVAWDFGGQDIYLGTHSLFIDDRAVFVLVWTPSLEDEAPVHESGLEMHNRTLDYWLAYVREFAGKAAPVLVVQSQCDRVSDEREAPVPAQHGFAWLKRVACSAKAEGGMDRLLPELRAAARLLQERHGDVMLPRSWVAVGRALREQWPGQRVAPKDEVLALCDRQGVAAPEAVLNYLHDSGAVFWRPEVFGGDVVLDQAWALDGMYAVLHRRRVLPMLREASGVFTPEWLGELLWNDAHGSAEQQHFLSMMLSCRVCFQLSERQYVVPDCLPPRPQRQSQEFAVWRDAAADAAAEVHFAFLHEGIKRLLLCELGAKAGISAVHWRWGLCYFDIRARVAVRVDCQGLGDAPGQREGCVRIEGSGSGARAHVEELVRSVLELTRSDASQVSWPVPGPEPVAPVESSRPLATTDSAEPPGRQGEAPFANLQAGPRPANGPQHKPRVHVSYAWQTESTALVDRLEAALQPLCDWRRDHSAMKPGDWISRFMAEIGASDCVVVVLSEKYLRSHFCMRELLGLYQTSQGEKSTMLDRIVPVVLPSADIDRAESRLTHAKHWKTRYDTIRAAAAGLDLLEQGEATRRELLAVADFKHHVVDMLAWLSDVLMPRVAQAGAQAGDDAAVDAAVELVRRRIGG